MVKIKLPKIGLGTMMGRSDKAKAAFIEGLQMGYRFLDTAQMYFNEKTVGAAVKESGIPREEFIVATKLWVTNFSPRRVKLTTERSLNRLNLEYIDILYLHFPARFSKIGDTFAAMSKLVDEGKVKHIAISNFSIEQTDKAIELCEKPIVANQVEMNPWWQQEELLAHLNKNDIHLVSYFPLLHGRFNDVPELVEIAKKHQVSGAQVSLAWIMSKGAIPIPKSANVAHLQDNYDSLKLKLTKEDIALIDNIEKEKHSRPF